ncbi:MAG: DUF499 domain-containing protein [Dehalococcoidia bacterium]
MSNYDRLSAGLKLYRDTMREFIGLKLRSAYGKGRWIEDALMPSLSPDQQANIKRAIEEGHKQGILARGNTGEAAVLDIFHFERVMRRAWDKACKITLKDQKKVLDWVKEVGEERNTWAHPPTGDLDRADVNRVLDSCVRVLRLVNAGVAKQVEALRDEAGQWAVGSGQSGEGAARGQWAVGGRQSGEGAVTAIGRPGNSGLPSPLEGEGPGVRGSTKAGQAATPPAQSPSPTPAPVLPLPIAHFPLPPPPAPVKGLPAWRTVIAPHPDVQMGRYQQAEFAADLAQVLAGKAEPEYQDPVEFFRRTFLTAGMQGLLRAAMDRLQGEGGKPVIQLKTSFGGGKTHTMLAVYHLVTGGTRVAALPGVRELLHGAAGPTASVAVLVGTALDPAKPSREAPALMAPVNTLWGEMAYQLGWNRPGAVGAAEREQFAGAAFRIVQESDAAGTAPGSNTLVQLFEQAGPCVILIDELVAFMRNIREARRLPAGSFNANMTFVQNLTEAVKRSPNAVLVASIPQSAIELGDSRGEEVARRIENTFGRLEAIWQPVAAHEGFEVVRRRLFSDLQDEAGREAVCRAFTDFYRQNPTDFPIESREGGYYERMLASYPIHPELFTRLYDDWSVLERFQRTRGVLRLMAAAIHELWRAGDASPRIMPGSLPLYSARVRDELTRYLGEQWNSVVDQDVDGDRAEPVRIDNENTRFGSVRAAQRVARAVFLGSVPQKSTRGIEEVRIRLGAAQAGESIAVYNDARGRLRDRLSHLYASTGPGGEGRLQGTDWYAVQTNLNRTVADRSRKVVDDDAIEELESRLRTVKGAGEFAAVHVAPAGSGDVPDEDRARLVILSPRHTHRGGREGRGSAALHAAQDLLDRRGNLPRTRRNMLIFLASHDGDTGSLLQETKRYCAWESIVKDGAALSLDQAQQKQAEEALSKSNGALKAKLDEVYKWVLVPVQEGTTAPDWDVIGLQGGTLGSQGTVVERAGYAMVSNELLITKWSPYHLQTEFDRYLWKDGQTHLSTKQLWTTSAPTSIFPGLRIARC